MKCWDNIIGIRGLCENEEYKYYLDDYGIGLKQLSKTADDKFISGKKLFKTKLNQAWESVFKDFKFNGFKSNKILNTISVGNFTENELQFIGFKGIKFTLLKCELTSFYLNKIYLYVKQGGTTIVKIKVNGVETELFNGTVGNDEVLELSVRDYISSDFEILVDGTNISVYDGTTSYNCDCNLIYFNVSGGLNYGLKVDLQVRCNPYDYLCNYVDLLAEAVIYKLSALLWKEALDSNRFNDFLNIKLGESNSNAITQLAWLDNTYNLLKYDINSTNNKQKGMYQFELEKISIPTPDCKCCLDCEGSSYRIVLP